MTKPQPVKSPVNNDKFLMLRCIIAMAHADGVVTPDEEAYIQNMLSRLDLAPAQLETLHQDLGTPRSIEGLMSQIRDPKYRGEVVHFARLLAYKDGNLDPHEDLLLKKMQVSATSGLDIETIRADVQAGLKQEMIHHEIRTDSKRPGKGLSGLLDSVMGRLGIDLMDE